MNIISGIGESGFLAHSAFSAGIATKDSNGNDITATYLTGVDLTPYQTTAGMTAYMATGDSAEFMTTAERSDYIPTGISSEFYTTANTANYISEVPAGYLQDSDLGISDNKITAISGVELSAGGDVPEGVMVESGIEYNSQGYINGYSGSAIATIDQERQWFTHDSTLCHLSNSSQYALGVNMSAISADLARMMGVDETEILASTATSAFTLTEPVTSFNKLEIKVNWWNKNPNCYYPVQIFDTGNIRVAGTYVDVAGDGSPIEVFGFNWTATNGLNYTLARAFAKYADVDGWGGATATPSVLSVRGIGRKS